MVEFLQVYLPIIIYILLVILIVIGIIIGFKLINFMDKLNDITDSVSEKVESFNGLFHAIDFATDKVNSFTTKIVDVVVGGLSKLFKRKNKSELDFEDEEEDDYE